MCFSSGGLKKIFHKFKKNKSPAMLVIVLSTNCSCRFEIFRSTVFHFSNNFWKFSIVLFSWSRLQKYLEFVKSKNFEKFKIRLFYDTMSKPMLSSSVNLKLQKLMEVNFLTFQLFLCELREKNAQNYKLFGSEISQPPNTTATQFCW